MYVLAFIDLNKTPEEVFMKQTQKSNILNYDAIYSILTLGITLCLFYICINFLLPIANFISFFFLALGSFSLICFIFIKTRLSITLALAFCTLSIGLSLICHYI